MPVVLDASALLAWFGGEPGAEEVEQHTPCCCSTANWVEVVQKVAVRGVGLGDIRSAVSLLGLVLEPVTAEDAETAAILWQDHPTLSLEDRLCLTLGHRLAVPILTADRA
ncbi:MAG: type II toxin-antitoxin system VapC family toxin [Propionibacteriaceae bacterium]|nr:type II toxin-antitoxin system VapC family toxin [Propionibacteriaceae bacterium]